jgi:protein TonB
MDLIIPVVILALLTLIATLLFKFFFFKKTTNIQSVSKLTEVEKLVLKKYKEVDVHKNRGYTLVAGMFVIMLFSIVLIEYGRAEVEEEVVVKANVSDVFDETLDIPQTKQPPPPPPPVAPPIKTSLVIKAVPDELADEIEIPVDTVPEELDLNFEEDEIIEEEEEVVVKVYEFVEDEAVPHNGDLFTYPEYIFSKMNKGSIKGDMEAGLKGLLEIEIIILEDGTPSGFNTISSVGPSIDKEIIRILKQAPKWKAAMMQGQAVRQKMLFQMMIDY